MTIGDVTVELLNVPLAVAVKEFAFKPEALRDQLIFKVPQRPGSYNLATDRFVDRVKQHQLTGFVFKLLWSLEDGPVSSKIKDYERLRITGLERHCLCDPAAPHACAGWLGAVPGCFGPARSTTAASMSWSNRV